MRQVVVNPLYWWELRWRLDRLKLVVLDFTLLRYGCHLIANLGPNPTFYFVIISLIDTIKKKSYSL